MKLTPSILRTLASISFIAGIILIVAGMFTGDTSAGLFLIVPFVTVSGPLAGLGILFVFAGIILYHFSYYNDGTLILERGEGEMNGDVDGDGWKRKMNGGVDGKRGTGELDEVQGTEDRMNTKCSIRKHSMRDAQVKGEGTKVRGGTSKKVRGGGIIFIGPIPIVFGDSVSMRYLVPAALVILLLMIIAAMYF